MDVAPLLDEKEAVQEEMQSSWQVAASVNLVETMMDSPIMVHRCSSSGSGRRGISRNEAAPGHCIQGGVRSHALQHAGSLAQTSKELPAAMA